MEFFFARTTDAGYDGVRHVQFNISTDGEWNTEVVDFSENANWNGTINQIRYDPLEKDGTGNVEGAVLETEADAQNYLKEEPETNTEEPGTNPETSDSSILLGSILITVIAVTIFARKRRSYLWY